MSFTSGTSDLTFVINSGHYLDHFSPEDRWMVRLYVAPVLRQLILLNRNVLCSRWQHLGNRIALLHLLDGDEGFRGCDRKFEMYVESWHWHYYLSFAGIMGCNATGMAGPGAEGKESNDWLDIPGRHPSSAPQETSVGWIQMFPQDSKKETGP